MAGGRGLGPGGVDDNEVRHLRATIGNTPTTPRSVDPKYLEYLAGATDNDLVVGAYHRAHVGRADGDAQGEADYFVNHAQIEGGDVLPVLDIEQTHGLDPAEMEDWVKTWVLRVRARTGVRPMLYSSPNFWNVHMGGTTWFADHDYPLWIAHWGVAAPPCRRGTGAGAAGPSGSGRRPARSRGSTPTSTVIASTG